MMEYTDKYWKMIIPLVKKDLVRRFGKEEIYTWFSFFQVRGKASGACTEAGDRQYDKSGYPLCKKAGAYREDSGFSVP